MAAGRPPKHRRSQFGKRLFALRQRRGLSQVRIAAMVGVTQQAYAGWERATVALRPESIARLAVLLAVSTDELLGVKTPRHASHALAANVRRLLAELARIPPDRRPRVLREVEALIARSGRRRPTPNAC